MVKRAAPYLQIGSVLAAQRILRDPVELAHGLFIMTEKESEAIAKPAISILARHQIGAEVLGDTDTSDAISLALAFVEYVSNNLKDRKILRAQYAPAYAPAEETDPGQEVRSTPPAPATDAWPQYPDSEMSLRRGENAEQDASIIGPESQMNYLSKFLPAGLS